MLICEIWLFDLYFPQFCKSDMSKYGYHEVFQRVPSSSKKTRVDCTYKSNSIDIYCVNAKNDPP